jgi:hypothetical protein
LEKGEGRKWDGEKPLNSATYLQKTLGTSVTRLKTILLPLFDIRKIYISCRTYGK